MAPGFIVLLLRYVGFVLNCYRFIGRTVYLLRACLWTSASGCSKDEFFGFGFGQSLYRIDYKENTSVLMYDKIGYDEAVSVIPKIIKRHLF